MIAENRSDLSDIRPGDWVDHFLWPSLRPYARLARIDRPVGIWLTLFPCIAALIQASGGLPAGRVLAVFCVGAFLMRSAGSTINDIADRNFDAHVERTRLRPLASGAINAKQAAIFLCAELALAATLLLFLSRLTTIMAIGVVPLVFAYPFCKRVTYWPQAVLGAAFNWGMLMAWTEVTGHVPLGAILMWLGATAWQIGYDTIYGYVDARDDARLGLRSTALLFANKGKAMIGLFYGLALMAWSMGGHLIGMSLAYQVGLGLI
jgi:4-hydroxybenzoate polyprenyltransferase